MRVEQTANPSNFSANLDRPPFDQLLKVNGDGKLVEVDIHSGLKEKVEVMVRGNLYFSSRSSLNPLNPEKIEKEINNMVKSSANKSSQLTTIEQITQGAKTLPTEQK